jgi:hypothetical protein
MHAFAALGVAAALGIASVPAVAAQTGDPGGTFDGGPAACSAVLTGPGDAAKSPPGAADLWVECNFRVTNLALRANRRLVAVAATPALYGPDPGDQLSCVRKRARRASCTGEVGDGVRVRVPMRALCKGALRVRVRASGGLDCDSGDACPAIGLAAVTSARSTPSGCG